MRISDWSSDVCSSDLYSRDVATIAAGQNLPLGTVLGRNASDGKHYAIDPAATDGTEDAIGVLANAIDRSEEHTSELQSLMRISYAVFCLKKKKKDTSSKH